MRPEANISKKILKLVNILWLKCETIMSFNLLTERLNLKTVLACSQKVLFSNTNKEKAQFSIKINQITQLNLGVFTKRLHITKFSSNKIKLKRKKSSNRTRCFSPFLLYFITKF